MRFYSRIKLSILMFILGFMGILSLLGMELPIPQDLKNEINLVFTPNQFKWIVLINPTILLLISCLIGSFTYEKAGFKLPIISRIIKKSDRTINYKKIGIYGICGGILSGILIILVSQLFESHIPDILKNADTPFYVRFLYGGITEEILMRFGLMSFIVWLLRLYSGITKKWMIWSSIIVSSLIFALGHLPIIMLLDTISFELITYIIIGNSVGGIIFGWIYWKRGLESAMLAHIFTHVIFIITEYL